jgi:hypothetical protein
MTYSKEDLAFFQSKEISTETIDQQISSFEKGFPFMDLVAPGTVHKGIIVFSEEELKEHATYYKNQTDVSPIKFVPASGAASRMFKDIYDFIETPSLDHPIVSTIQNYSAFAFGEDVDKHFQAIDTSNLEDLVKLADFIVNKNGLNYGNSPKGLINFHKYKNGNRTAFAEHLIEAAKYATRQGVARLHFTVSQEHLDAVQSHINTKKEFFEKEFNVSYEISYSVQKPSTDTLAVDKNNEPFRNPDGSILFRPGGHGALIHNLNDIQEELIFIKNIDNVVPDAIKVQTVEYKKALAGLLLETKNKVHTYIKELNTEGLTEEKMLEIAVFALTTFGIKAASIDQLLLALNKPIRVCGMVKNQGEPGGGPFWVTNADGQKSLQIVESSQIDPNSAEQQNLVKHATHFNPVDLICYTKDFSGKKFNLEDFIDTETGFITNKSKNGKEVKALELPGLWNGAMANWLSLYVQVPLITFNPVKTIKDLLRKEHISQ